MSWKTGGKRPRKPLEIQIAGQTFKGWVPDIFKQYIRWAEAAGRRLTPGWENAVWRRLQRKYPHYILHEPDEETPVQVSTSTVTSFVNFMKQRRFDRSIVSTQEAERRADICRECPMRATISGCPKCQAALRAIVGTPKKEIDFGTRYGKKVKACGACGCYLGIKVWIPMDFLKDQKTSHPWWEKCWMRE